MGGRWRVGQKNQDRTASCLFSYVHLCFFLPFPICGRTAHAALDDYVKKGNYKSHERIFIVHRLDRDTSGALVFARSEKAKLTLQKNWEQAEKTYLAFVEGHPDPPSGTIQTQLWSSLQRGAHDF